MSYYQRIKDLREDADKKQSEIAEALFMHLTQYGRYERGEREIPLNIAAAIAKYYNVSLDYLAGFTNYKNSIRPDSLSEEEYELLAVFRSLNNFEKGQIFERIRMLAENHSNRKKT